tara:strand:+ start:1219 stop:1695 length:477 start_codon:yes stop_codon:yes gene_type:complete
MRQQLQIYWNEEGEYQEEYEKLFKSLIPEEGRANDNYSEILRCFTKIYQDYHINGLGNYPIDHMCIIHIIKNEKIIKSKLDDPNIFDSFFNDYTLACPPDKNYLLNKNTYKFVKNDPDYEYEYDKNKIDTEIEKILDAVIRLCIDKLHRKKRRIGGIV